MYFSMNPLTWKNCIWWLLCGIDFEKHCVCFLKKKMKQKLRHVHPFDFDVLWWLSLKTQTWTYFLQTRKASQQWFLATGPEHLPSFSYKRAIIPGPQCNWGKCQHPNISHSPIFHKKKWSLKIVLLIIPLKAKCPSSYAWEVFSSKSPKVLLSQWFAVSKYYFHEQNI